MADINHDHRAAPRYSVDTPVEGKVGEQPFAGQLKDISATGADVTGIGNVGFENDQFVQLHMAGMGTQSGYVRRRIPEGFALQFAGSEEEQQRKREVEDMIRAMGVRGLQG